MITSFLFDLDGTLFPIDMNDLKQRLFELLQNSAFVQSLGENGFHHFLNAFRAVHHNKTGQINQLRFYESLSSLTGLEKEAIISSEADFYERDFLGLETILKKPDPYAKKVINLLNDKGYSPILATAPVFPKQAIIQRLNWSGLEENDFSFITSYDTTCHYKGEAYYLELSKKIKTPPEECLMIGNSVEEDLIAKEIGMNVFFVNQYPVGTPDFPVQQGSLKDLYAYILSLPDCAF